MVDSVGLNMVAYTVLALSLTSILMSIKAHKRNELALLTIALCTTSLLLMMTYTVFMALHGLHVEIPLIFLRLKPDAYSVLTQLNVVLVSLAALVSSHRYLELYRGKIVCGPYYLLLLVFIFSMFLILLVDNWLWFLLLLELITITAYFLIGYECNIKEVIKTAWMYFVSIHVLSMAPLIAAIGLYYASIGTLNFISIKKAELTSVALILFLISFIAESGIFPFHFWLPKAHSIAPSPISALLSAASVKIGVYGILRVLSIIRNLNIVLVNSVISLAMLSCIAALVSYIRQPDYKRVFAWSTISHIGWIYIALFLKETFLACEYIVNHGLAKAAAFLTTGLLMYTLNTVRVKDLKGSYNKNRIAIGLMIMSILAIEGLPPFNLFFTKVNIVIKAVDTNTFLGLFLIIEWSLSGIILLKFITGLVSGRTTIIPSKGLPLSLLCAITFLLFLLTISQLFLRFLEIIMKTYIGDITNVYS